MNLKNVSAYVWNSIYNSAVYPAYSSVRISVEESVRDSVWFSGGSPAQESVRFSVWDSVRQSMKDNNK
jgi:hypothetical protein